MVCVQAFEKSSYGQIVIEIAASHAIGPNVIVKLLLVPCSVSKWPKHSSMEEFKNENG